MSNKSNRSETEDGQKNNFEETPYARNLNLVVGKCSLTKEERLRRKLLKKKTLVTEKTLRQKLLDKMAIQVDPCANTEKPSTSQAQNFCLEFNLIPEPKSSKKRLSRNKKSKRSRSNSVDLKELTDKSVLHRVIIRHLNPKSSVSPTFTKKKKHSSKKKKSKRKNSHKYESDDKSSSDLEEKKRDEQKRRRSTKNDDRNNDDYRPSLNYVKNITKFIVDNEEKMNVELKENSQNNSILSTRGDHQMRKSPTNVVTNADGSVVFSSCHSSPVPLEEKNFAKLTEEEMTMISPRLLARKEAENQQELIKQLPVYYPGIYGCRKIDQYQILYRIEEGTFGVVYCAVESSTEEMVALKRLKMEKEREGFPITSLREINMMMKCRHHPNVVQLKEVVVGSTMDKIYLVMEYVEHDLKALLKRLEDRKSKFTLGQVKALMYQLLSVCAYLHNEWVIHRDLKSSNLLLSQHNVLKIADFGLAREYGDPLKEFTPVVVTLWYRCPELLLGVKKYSTAVDIWSIGCLLGEFLLLHPIFTGKSEIDMLNKIFMNIGTPNETIWPGYNDLPGTARCVFANTPYNQLRRRFMPELKTETGLEFMNGLLAPCPDRRMSAEEALKHPFFTEEPKCAPLETFPEWSDRQNLNSMLSKRLKPVDKGLQLLPSKRRRSFDEMNADARRV